MAGGYFSPTSKFRKTAPSSKGSVGPGEVPGSPLQTGNGETDLSDRKKPASSRG